MVRSLLLCPGLGHLDEHLDQLLQYPTAQSPGQYMEQGFLVLGFSAASQSESLMTLRWPEKRLSMQ